MLTARNGTTIEVLNTDAEGRLVLADGLCLAVEANPDAIIDVATLTGAQTVAFGDEIGAYFATDRRARRVRRGRQPRVRRAAVAYAAVLGLRDLSGIPGRRRQEHGRALKASSVTAALILRRFTDGRPWVHLDIAGPSRAESDRGYTTKGGTAFGLRAIVALLSAVAADAAPVSRSA